MSASKYCKLTSLEECKDMVTIVFSAIFILFSFIFYLLILINYSLTLILLINFCLCWIFVAARGLSLVVASRGYSSLRCEYFSF